MAQIAYADCNPQYLAEQTYFNLASTKHINQCIKDDIEISPLHFVWMTQIPNEKKRQEMGQIMIEALKEQEFDLNSAIDGRLTFFGDFTLLQATVMYDAPDIAKMVITAGADVNTVTANGMTALTQAVYSDNMAMVKLLVDAGADAAGPAPLKFAVDGNHLDIADFLLNAGAVADNALLESTITQSKAAMASLLIEAGADIHATDKYGNTFLAKAIDKKSVAMATLLIEAGADVNTPDKDGNTLLGIALSWRYLGILSTDRDLDMAKLLIEAGADVNARGQGNNTLLFNVVGSNNLDAVRLLVDAGAEVNTDGKHLLTNFQGFGGRWQHLPRYDELIVYLIEAGLNVQNDIGGSALVQVAGYPVQNEQNAIGLALINAGAPLNFVNQSQNTAITSASGQSNAVLVKALIEAGADVNIPAYGGCSALDRARDAEIQLMLKAAGALCSCNKRGTEAWCG
ncbi:MAG: ankyrin repeat domain-containing protein [Aestuariivita sp.]|nr:ankyrin repeat domain-containing protein [Aestuariivita sp.]MCY4345372.1 ankyrin repeat domain-containing protein [Aestuariivita sp.]